MPLATIIISTKDRPHDLRETLNRIKNINNYGELEVIVTDDGSHENMINIFQRDYPEIKFYRYEKPKGYIYQRNRMLKIAKGDYIFSLDDEAYFKKNDSIEKAIIIFGKYPKAGILNFKVTLPSGCVIPPGDANLDPYPVAQFMGCAHAVRKKCFDVQSSYYDELYFRQGEERDLAIKCIDHGYEILQVNDIVVFHNYQEQGRDHQWIHSYAFRNELFFYLKYFPGFSCPLFLLKCFISHTIFCTRKLWLRAYLLGILGFVKLLPKEIQKRRPVSHNTIRKYLKLMRNTSSLGSITL